MTRERQWTIADDSVTVRMESGACYIIFASNSAPIWAHYLPRDLADTILQDAPNDDDGPPSFPHCTGSAQHEWTDSLTGRSLFIDGDLILAEDGDPPPAFSGCREILRLAEENAALKMELAHMRDLIGCDATDALNARLKAHHITLQEAEAQSESSTSSPTIAADNALRLPPGSSK